MSNGRNVKIALSVALGLFLGVKFLPPLLEKVGNKSENGRKALARISSFFKKGNDAQGSNNFSRVKGQVTFADKARNLGIVLPELLTRPVQPRKGVDVLKAVVQPEPVHFKKPVDAIAPNLQELTRKIAKKTNQQLDREAARSRVNKHIVDFKAYRAARDAAQRARQSPGQIRANQTFSNPSRASKSELRRARAGSRFVNNVVQTG